MLYALVPTVGTMLIILFANQQTYAGKFVGNKLFVGLGLISYSAYLWHQPLLAFGKFRNFGDLNNYLAISIVIITFILAYFSWLYIEIPVRTRQVLTSRKSLFLASTLGVFIFVLVGFYGVFNSYLGKRSTPVFLKSYESNSEYIADNFYLIAESWELQKQINGVSFFGVDKIPKDRELLFNLSDRRNKLLVVGNSHSVDFFNVLYHSKKIYKRFQLARFGVQITDIDDTFFTSPNYRSADIVAYCSLMSGGDIENIERVVSRALEDNKKVFVCENIFTWMERSNFTKLDKLIVNGLRNGKAAQDLASNINEHYTIQVFGGNYVDEQRKLYAIKFSEKLIQLSVKHKFHIINRMNYVCPNKKCKLVSESLGKYFFDMGHHTMVGAKYFSTIVDKGDYLNELLDAM